MLQNAQYDQTYLVCFGGSLFRTEMYRLRKELHKKAHSTCTEIATLEAHGIDCVVDESDLRPFRIWKEARLLE